MTTYILGSDDALLPCEVAWWSHALHAVRYTAERMPMNIPRVILAHDVAYALCMALTVTVKHVREDE